MCTLFGVLGKQDVGELESAFSCVAHRGREVTRFMADTEKYIYARLPTDGLQVSPTLSSEHPYTFLNGIVYNVERLHELFSLPAYTRESDTLTLHEGLRRYGVSFARHCRGMFACAFVTQDHVYLVRDTIGIKPLYYARDEHRFAFSSELKALVALRFVTIDEVGAGHVVQYEKQTHRIERQTFAYLPDSRQQTIESILDAALVAPTKRYLAQATSKSVGLLLSGGLDSSILLAVLRHRLTKAEFDRIVTVCVGDTRGADQAFAAHLCRTYGKKLHVVRPYSAAYCMRHLRRMVYMVESPYARTVKAAFLQDAAAAYLSAQNIDVVISGEGADELFYGYSRFITGIRPAHTHSLYEIFFREIFPKTLLQRLDRVFSAHTIEARVPFLDQELVSLASRLPLDAFYVDTDNGLYTKLPLRVFAARMGLPKRITDRAKVSMTLGATGLENSEDPSGYLEEAAAITTGESVAKLVSEYYKELFGVCQYGARELARDLRTRELQLVSSFRREGAERIMQPIHGT